MPKKPKIYLRLTGKFLLPIVAILIAGAVIGLMASYQYTSDALKSSIRQDLEYRTLSIARNIDAWLIEIQHDLSFFSKEDVFKDALLTQSYLGRSARQSATVEMKRMANENTSMDQVYLLGVDDLVMISSQEGSQDIIDVVKKKTSILEEALMGRNAISAPVALSNENF